MQMTERRRATYDDLLRVPEQLVAEIVDGELVTSPRPALPHALAASGIGSILFHLFHGPPGGGGPGPGGWVILYEPELHLRDDVLVPDLAGWRRERMAVVSDAAAVRLAPDWVCEVVSPGTARLDRLRKMPIYAREGVAWVWIIDPPPRTVEIYRLTPAGFVVVPPDGPDDALRAEPFAAMALDARRWWREDEPARAE